LSSHDNDCWMADGPLQLEDSPHSVHFFHLNSFGVNGGGCRMVAVGT
jgi:hypothetical protein